jgi:hypothetical protein
MSIIFEHRPSSVQLPGAHNRLRDNIDDEHALNRVLNLGKEEMNAELSELSWAQLKELLENEAFEVIENDLHEVILQKLHIPDGPLAYALAPGARVALLRGGDEGSYYEYWGDWTERVLGNIDDVLANAKRIQFEVFVNKYTQGSEVRVLEGLLKKKIYQQRYKNFAFCGPDTWPNAPLTPQTVRTCATYCGFELAAPGQDALAPAFVSTLANGKTVIASFGPDGDFQGVCIFDSPIPDVLTAWHSTNISYMQWVGTRECIRAITMLTESPSAIPPVVDHDYMDGLFEDITFLPGAVHSGLDRMQKRHKISQYRM